MKKKDLKPFDPDDAKNKTGKLKEAYEQANEIWKKGGLDFLI